MRKELELSGKTPLTKKDIEALSLDLLSPVLDGDVDPVSHTIKLKAMQEALKKTLCDDRLKDAVLAEVEKYGKERLWNGATIKIKDVGATYDYTVCGDPVYNAYMVRLKELQSDIKEREDFLRSVPDNTTIVDDSTGEIVTLHPAVKMARQGYSITFKKQ